MSAGESITSLPDAVAALGALPVPASPALSELERMQLRVDEVERAYTFDTAELKRRIAELEAERHSTNEALSDAAERMRADRDRIAELEAQREVLAERLRAGQQWRQGRNPELVSENFVSQSELRSIFGIPLVAPWADGLTAVFSPVASLRKPEGEHWAAVHHSYRVPRDLPEMGGTQ